DDGDARQAGRFGGIRQPRLWPRGDAPPTSRLRLGAQAGSSPGLVQLFQCPRQLVAPALLTTTAGLTPIPLGFCFLFTPFHAFTGLVGVLVVVVHSSSNSGSGRMTSRVGLTGQSTSLSFLVISAHEGGALAPGKQLVGSCAVPNDGTTRRAAGPNIAMSLTALRAKDVRAGAERPRRSNRCRCW